MTKMAVVKTGGKQYLVKSGDEIVVDKLPQNKDEKVELETLALLDVGKDIVELGSPVLSKKTSAQVVEQGKGDKVRVAKFKSKVRYRKVTGFRASLTRIKILTI